MQETNSRKKSSPQTRLVSGLMATMVFAVAFAASAQVFSSTADAMMQPAVAKTTTPAAKTPNTLPFDTGRPFAVDIGPYVPTVPDREIPMVEEVSATTSTTPATSSQASAAASSQAPAASSSQAAAAPAQTTAGFDPATVGGTNFSLIAEWKKVNPDVSGWIRIPNTNINYPVLYHSDTNYYLERDVYKNYSKNGVIWADQEVQYGPDKSTRNTVLYGHNWTNISNNPRIGNANDVMFAQLTAFQHLSFAQKTPYIHYSTADKESTWVVFAAFYTDINFNYISCFPNDTLFVDTVNGARARSEHIYDVDILYSDKILTLSTCTRAFGSSANQRFVVMARELRPGETTQKAIDIKSNPAPVRPVL